MTKRFLILPVFLLFITCYGQKKEEYFDFSFKPAKIGGRYYVITEKQGELWHREAYYIPELTMAMNAWYKDEACKIPHDTMTWYHATKYVKSIGTYIDGKKEGMWLQYDEQGRMRDSATYSNGHLNGIGLGWHSNGIPSDSTSFDGEGNGVKVTWDDEGNVTSAGRMEQDTLCKGRWQYFSEGKLIATVDFANGKKIACNCFDEKGSKLDTAICNEEKEANFPGGLDGWRKFLERTLDASVPARKGAKDGHYTILLKFRVDKEGNLQDLKATTNYGFGMEQEALRVLKRSPKWEPAVQFGRHVNAYRIQPITFVVVGR